MPCRRRPPLAMLIIFTAVIAGGLAYGLYVGVARNW